MYHAPSLVLFVAMRYCRLTPALLAALALACPAQPQTREINARDDRRPAEPLTTSLFGTPLQLGGSWEYTDERRDNFDLNSANARDRRVREHEIKLEARALIDERTQGFAQLVGLHETRRTQGDEREVRRSLERGQLWWQRERLFGTPWSVQVGRVELLDRRAWWWDEDLDAVRVRYAGSGWRLDTGLARELARKSSADSNGVASEQRGVTRWFGQATWPWMERHALDAFWLLQNDASSRPASSAVFADEDRTDPSDLNARWVGLRASGEWRFASPAGSGPRLAYWADTAILSGRERVTPFDEQDNGNFIAGATQRRKVSGNAFDIGVTGTLSLPLRPSLTVGYARGSSGFRQTGLQENKSRFSGVKRWQRYGELLQPELANLSVATLGAGVRLFDNTSVELAAHRYRQVRAADAIRGARLSNDPQGTNRSLGREVNLLLAVRESKRVELLFKASHFKPGAAFAPDRRDAARAIEFGVSVNF
jgi:alginate production protein